MRVHTIMFPRIQHKINMYNIFELKKNQMFNLEVILYFNFSFSVVVCYRSLEATPTAYVLRKVEENPFRKHAYSNILKSSPPKTESFQIKNSDIFHIFA